tara:strand:- start:8293 stop:9210 length:918 start_codon:yes stop_codon:yes gene_type:complete
MDKSTKMKNILITGGLGYVGSEILGQLRINQKDKVVVTDSRFIAGSVAECSFRGAKFFQRDILDIGDLASQADIVFHCAGITAVPQTKAQSTPEIDAEITRVGTLGTRSLLSSMRSDAKIVFFSTHVVFEGLKETLLEINEENAPSPMLAYSTSKLQSEKDIQESGKNHSILRLGSVYGFNHSMRIEILPNLFSKLASQGKQLKVFGGDSLKPLVGIEDVARAAHWLSSEEHVGIFNVVNETRTVMQVAETCAKNNPKSSIIEVEGETINNGYSLSSMKLLNTGFKFKSVFEDEIRYMVKDWMVK